MVYGFVSDNSLTLVLNEYRYKTINTYTTLAILQ